MLERALCKNRIAGMGSGSCFCVMQYKLPTHAGLFNSQIIDFSQEKEEISQEPPLQSPTKLVASNPIKFFISSIKTLTNEAVDLY